MSLREILAKIPGGLMIVPLMVGALLNTVDEMHLGPVEAALKFINAPAIEETVEDPHTGEEVTVKYYEFLEIGGFTTALARKGTLPLIGMFLVCVASQMNFRVGAQALKKGAVITTAKFIAAISMGYLISTLTDPFSGLFGLSLVAIVAAMSNGNGGLYLALTGEYGDRSDVGAVSVISLNDGPFLTLVALGLTGESFPFVAFLAVLLPMLVGFLLGQWHESIRTFLSHGEKLVIPFFAFALGTTMSFAAFFDLNVLTGGLFLGIATVVCSGGLGVLALKIIGEPNQIAAVAEASTAGNAVQTPLAVASAASLAAAAGAMSAERAEDYQSIVETATAQISISTITTAILCPLAVIAWHRWQNGCSNSDETESSRDQDE
ncbi:2-keto-3-deoxygluconate permease [Stratiformator vulcanicus]|uniref:2-keto-3-deoxygluconate permease n=1 Tax=Stratiformator vulcanicus TaxID=2527980 RepID=A0A517R1D7_9PLAN|nr:2-keto-3-deoxygluconate permease [Stratiformator vulcanicus]QDT37709.1 2-keto-3-deoxygluconate permease [Stratiformator vulcanicus]